MAENGVYRIIEKRKNIICTKISDTAYSHDDTYFYQCDSMACYFVQSEINGAIDKNYYIHNPFFVCSRAYFGFKKLDYPPLSVLCRFV